MKLSSGADIENFSIAQLAILRDDLIAKYQQKFKDTKQRQAEIIAMQDELVQIQGETIALGDDVIAVNKKMEELIGKAKIEN